MMESNIFLDFSEDFEIEDLGYQEIDVYDIEVEGNHNFFANDVLVHNSIYVDFNPFVDMYMNNHDIKDEQLIVDYIDNISKKLIEPELKRIYENLDEYVGLYENHLDMDRENIMRSAFWTAKKRYAALTWDNEGVRYDKPKRKVMGMQIRRSDCPLFIRGKLTNFIDDILYENALNYYIFDFEEEYKNTPIEQIAIPTGMNNIEGYEDNTVGLKVNVSEDDFDLLFNSKEVSDCYTTRTPIHVRASIIHNYLIDKYKLTNKYPYINSGDKIKYIYLITPNPIKENVVAFIDKFPKEFDHLRKYINWDKMFFKSFNKIITDITKNLDTVNVEDIYGEEIF